MSMMVIIIIRAMFLINALKAFGTLSVHLSLGLLINKSVSQLKTYIILPNCLFIKDCNFLS